MTSVDKRPEIWFHGASFFTFAQVVELVDTPDLGSGAAWHVGSSPILGIFLMKF